MNDGSSDESMDGWANEWERVVGEGEWVDGGRTSSQQHHPTSGSNHIIVLNSTIFPVPSFLTVNPGFLRIPLPQGRFLPHMPRREFLVASSPPHSNPYEAYAFDGTTLCPLKLSSTSLLVTSPHSLLTVAPGSPSPFPPQLLPFSITSTSTW